jgi:hypothetical protein
MAVSSPFAPLDGRSLSPFVFRDAKRANSPDAPPSYGNNKKEKKEVCIRKPPSWLSCHALEGDTAKTVRLAQDVGGCALQGRVGAVDFTPADFARRPAQFATKSTVETFGLLDAAFDSADFAARGADVFDITAELLEQRIQLAQLFFDVADIRMTTVKLT